MNSYDAFRQEVRRFIAQELTDDMRHRARVTGTSFDAGLYRALARRRWIVPDWPRAEGGDDRRGVELAILREELRRAEAPLDGWRTSSISANILREYGTPDQKATFLAPLLDGSSVHCLGISEPDSGSDAASARTKAVWDHSKGAWRISGQKMWTTLAHVSSHVFLLARTGPEKHAGLTTFLVPLDSPGVEIRPIETLGGERTNATFYDDVVVDELSVLGGVGNGWNVMRRSLVFERLWDAGELLLLCDLAARTLAAEDSDPGCHALAVVGQLVLEARAARALSYRASIAAREGHEGVLLAAMAKLYGSESQLRSAEALLDVAASRMAGGLRSTEEGHLMERFKHAFRHAQVKTIYGGASEVLLDLIARQGLGLPLSRG